MCDLSRLRAQSHHGSEHIQHALFHGSGPRRTDHSDRVEQGNGKDILSLANALYRLDIAGLAQRTWHTPALAPATEGMTGLIIVPVLRTVSSARYRHARFLAGRVSDTGVSMQDLPPGYQPVGF